MGKDDQSAGERRRTLARRPFLGAMVAAGLAGCGGDDESTDTPAATPSGTAEPTDDPSTPRDLSWPSIEDPYFASLADWLEGEGVPPGEFVYGASEPATAEAYAVEGDPATTTELDVGSEVPFSQATRVEITEAPADPWVVTMKGIVEDRDVAESDVLLGVASLRGPEASETEPIVNYAVKDEDNESTNMVQGQAEITLGTEWQQYAFPIAFDYDSEAGTWWTEFFLGYDVQTVDVGGLALLDFGTDVTANDLPSGAIDAGDSGGGSIDDGDWESRADARIEEHRTADLTVDVTDADGDPVEAADVAVTMTEHDFGFGTAINADHLVNETSEGDTYRQHVTDLFNTVVMENHHKWRFWEENTDVADAATQWANDREMAVRGHVCLWANVEGWAVPADVVEAMGVEWQDGGVDDPELDPEYVRQRTFDHVTEIVEHYGEDVAEWEVVNEVTHQPGLIEAVNGVRATEDEQLEDVDPVEASVLADWYATAREATPEGTPIGVNDYNTLAGPNPSTRQQYERQIDFLAGQDAGLDFAGLQSHFQESSALSPTETKAALDAYADQGVRLRITEFDMADEGWDEAEKATFFHDFLTVAFSHPAVDDFLVWGINSGMHWREDAPFFTADWEAKPALDEYESLVFDEWWTEEEGTTDAEGTYATTGFKGEYEVTATIDGEAVTRTATLGDGGATVELSPEEGTLRGAMRGTSRATRP